MGKVSVIIPCYNHGAFISDAVESVLSQTYKDFEIVIIDDGSTDVQTNLVLSAYKHPLIRIIRTENQGLAGARNNGIRQSTGIYILPLDADDKIESSYMEKAVRVLNANPNIGIVYCQAEFFGEKRGKWELPEYNFPEILLGNVIFCSGFYRKSDWQQANGYNPNMKYGWADYDFWLSLIELGRDIYRIPESLFFYRQRSDSMNKSITQEQQVYLFAQLVKNHTRLYHENPGILLQLIMHLREQVDELENNGEELNDLLDQLQKGLAPRARWTDWF